MTCDPTVHYKTDCFEDMQAIVLHATDKFRIIFHHNKIFNWVFNGELIGFI